MINQILEILFEEDNPRIVAIYGGGFKPPTKGHFAVVEKTLADFPEIDELIIYVGGGVRDGITQEESIKIWEIYKNYLSPKVKILPSIAPVKSVLDYAKENPTDKVYWVLGAREGDEDDIKDIENRTRSVEKYPNLEVKVITTKGGVSGTKTRQAIKAGNKEQFFYMIPDVEEKEEIWNLVTPAIKEVKNRRAEIIKAKKAKMEAKKSLEEGFIENTQENMKKLLLAIKQEGKETRDAFKLVLQAAKGEIQLTDEQKKQIGDQLKDVLKAIGLISIAILPGSFIVGALIKIFKAERLVFPSSLLPEEEKKETNETSELDEADPKKGTGKKPEGSGRRLYTDEDPKDTVRIKFKTKEDIVDTLNKKQFKAKSHARQSQVINLIHQRVRAAYGKAKDPEVKSRLKRALDYIESRKESSKEKTKRLNKLKEFEGDSNPLNLPYIDTWHEGQYKAQDGKTEEAIKLMTKAADEAEKYAKETQDDGINGEAGYYRGTIAWLKKDYTTVEKYINNKNVKITGNDEVLKRLLKNKDKSYKEAYNLQEASKEKTKRLNKLKEEKELNVQDLAYQQIPGLLEKGINYGLSHFKSFIKSFYKWSGTKDKNEFFDFIESLNGEIKRVPLNSIIPSQKGKYYKNASSEYEAEEFLKILNGEKSVEDHRKEDFYPIIVNKRDNKIIDGNHRHYALSSINSPYAVVLYIDVPEKYLQEASNPQAGTALPYGSGFAPIKENDPFGLNEFAKQFVKEVFEEGWNFEEGMVSLTKYMIDNGMNIKPLPKIKVIDNDKDNASKLLGKTAHYDPVEKSITLFTMNRHPKDVLRSFAHEMIHHEQNLENKLGNISTTNTNEDGDLPEIEREAYEKGNMMLRNWEDNIKAPLKEYFLDIPKFNQPKTFAYRLRESLNEITLNSSNAVEIYGGLTNGKFQVGDIIYVYDIAQVKNPYDDGGDFYNIMFHPKDNKTSTPQQGKENYIKILNTMYKVILDFVEEAEPEYIGIASLDNNDTKNYHTVYATLTDNKYNRIPGYFRKDVNLPFNTPEGKGRFVVLKRKNVQA